MDQSAVGAVLAALEREHVRYAVIGGVALNLLGLARYADDLDIFLVPERANVEALKRALHSVYADQTIDEISTDGLLGALPFVQYVSPDGTFRVDVLTRFEAVLALDDVDLAFEHVPFADLMVSVVTPRTLFEMKRRSNRPADRADADALRRRFGFSEDP